MKSRESEARIGSGSTATGTGARRRRAAWPGIPLAAAIALGAASGDATTTLEVRGAWVRAMPPGRAMTAAYATIENKGTVDVTLTGVSASRGDASLHESMRVDGRMSMRPVEKLSIPAGGEIRLEPGGLHVMLMGLERVPAEGESVELCFDSDAQELCVDAPVMKRAP